MPARNWRGINVSGTLRVPLAGGTRNIATGRQLVFRFGRFEGEGISESAGIDRRFRLSPFSFPVLSLIPCSVPYAVSWLPLLLLFHRRSLKSLPDSPSYLLRPPTCDPFVRLWFATIVSTSLTERSPHSQCTTTPFATKSHTGVGPLGSRRLLTSSISSYFSNGRIPSCTAGACVVIPATAFLIQPKSVLLQTATSSTSQSPAFSSGSKLVERMVRVCNQRGGVSNKRVNLPLSSVRNANVKPAFLGSLADGNSRS